MPRAAPRLRRGDGVFGIFCFSESSLVKFVLVMIFQFER